MISNNNLHKWKILKIDKNSKENSKNMMIKKLYIKINTNNINMITKIKKLAQHWQLYTLGNEIFQIMVSGTSNSVTYI